jgi:hypothetical protein
MPANARSGVDEEAFYSSNQLSDAQREKVFSFSTTECMPYLKGNDQLYTEILQFHHFRAFCRILLLDAANNLQMVRKESAPRAALAPCMRGDVT